ncbi:hypothetical protein RO3G_06060 [Rhizopus delemar RA 99-880]|uniref:Uncharacterized protein n=1 Tax=Rhizopus delemar (strain RA 99-880 / ATCC MYA-4621 / FGSC 9543 / NRRL 43880) TaxID=246409 RepID=I1BYS5_RHIO9|nr:hypothetical protein RO3G_06060 [Rhizopus delemar RA 99-880]|eukprot:EIE81355.1 hypothetical protein RO3G_06060 [Rhizopus delemar RA 99-880]
MNRVYAHRRPINGYQRVIDDYSPVKHSVLSSKSNSSTIQDSYLESREKNQLLRELYQVKEDITRFKSELNGLAEQMDGMELHLNLSENRVQEIEQDITATQEVNVNLQVILERAVHKQKETDVYATRAMKNIHTHLATVFYETGQLRGRLISIANYQRQQQGSVIDVAERIREYSKLLEEAIQSIQSKPKKRMSLPEKKQEPIITVRKKSLLDNNELYKHRIIRKRVIPESNHQSWLPQKGLRILLSDTF